MAALTSTEFLEHFVLPLVVGGDLHVGKPIDARALETLEQDLAHASVPLVAIDEGRERVLGELVVKPPACVFGEDELRLAAAVHNLLFLVHPDADGWSMTEAARSKIIGCAQSFAAQPRSKDRSTVLARHALLHNLFNIGRIDIQVTWWTGSTTFYGQAIPRRLARWPDVRRVSRHISHSTFQELFQGADVSAVVASLMLRSPLTAVLLKADPLGAPLHWEDCVFLLRDAEITRALAYRSVLGNTPASKVAAPERFTVAFEQMLVRSPKVADVRTVLAFLVYLNYLFALEESTSKVRPESPLIVASLSESKSRRASSSFFALADAAQRVDERLASPPGLAANPLVMRRFEAHREQVLKTLGETKIEILADRLRRHLVPDSMLESVYS